MKSQKHTPIPWEVDEFDGHIYIVAKDDPMLYVTEMVDPKDDPEGSYPSPKERTANAELIVRAVNAHEELVHLAKFVRNVIDNACGQLLTDNEARRLFAMATKAIAKAEGRS